MKLITEIQNDLWTPIMDANLKAHTPYWFKKPSGTIVLATYTSSNGCTGWAETTINEQGQFMTSGNSFHILGKSLVQPAIKE